jgi:ABC-2 type transport system permease protein
VVLASLVGAWLLLFFMMAIIGALALFVESATGIFEIWLGLHFILSGYLIPLELLPGWMHPIARVLPFRYTLSFPVETLIGLHGLGPALQDLCVQWLYVAGLFATTLLVWKRGMRRFVAFGG